MSMFRRRLVMAQGEGRTGIPSTEAVAGDVCMYRISEGKLIIVNDWDASKYPINKYHPIGVVVIPGSHNVYGDGSCAIMSLVEMDYNNPDIGATSNTIMRWGNFGVNINGLGNYDKMNYVISGTNITENITSVGSVGYLPSDKFSKVANPYDIGTYYNTNSSLSPSPYQNDGSFNPNYSNISLSENNATSDFKGKSNTDILISLAVSQSNWKTADSIINEGSEGYSPAACCCWRFHTLGTNQGDWYLPAAGELGYIMPRYNKINNSINKLIESYGQIGVTLGTQAYWTSTKRQDDSTRYVYPFTGEIGIFFSRTDNICVRAFLRVK